jgi:hypothetical protein
LQALQRVHDHVTSFDEKLGGVQSVLADVQDVAASFERCVLLNVNERVSSSAPARPRPSCVDLVCV